MRLAVMPCVVARSPFIAVQCDRDAVAEDGQQCANWYGDGAHRPNVHPNRHAKGRCSRRRDRAAESRNYSNGEQESWGTDWEPRNPRRKALQILLESPEPGHVPIDPVAQQGRAEESKRVNEGTLNGSEYRPVHDGQGVGHRKRR